MNQLRKLVDHPLLRLRFDNYWNKRWGHLETDIQFPDWLPAREQSIYRISYPRLHQKLLDCDRMPIQNMPDQLVVIRIPEHCYETGDQQECSFQCKIKS